VTFSVWREPVQEAWIDYNGHLSEAYYVLVLGHATDAVMDTVGLGPEYRSANDASLYTVEAHVRYLGEVSADSDLEVRSSIIGVTAKLLWIWHELWVEGRLRATEEILGVHVRRGSSAPLPGDVVARAGDVCVTPPAHASGRIGPIPAPRPAP
jgi:acyl-CoA thioester hydrolase